MKLLNKAGILRSIVAISDYKEFSFYSFPLFEATGKPRDIMMIINDKPLDEYEETSFTNGSCAYMSCSLPCCCPVYVCWVSLFLPCLACDHFLCQAAVCDKCCFETPAKDSKIYSIHSRAALRYLGWKVVPGENKYPLDLDFEPLTSRIVSTCPLICCLDSFYVMSGGADH